MATAPSYFEFNAGQPVDLDALDLEPSLVVVEEQDMTAHERDKLHHAHRRYINRLTCEATEALLQRVWAMEGKR